MTSEHLQKLYALRARLHETPELSGREDRTRDILEAFLRENTGLVLRRGGGALLASHIEGEELETLAFRADMDAIPVENDACRARHGCGHDGHCAILCALALMIEGRRLGKNLHLVFQSAEETGEGARRALAALPELRQADFVYGLHNIPGHPRGALLLRRGCFACASEGLIVDVTGRPAHAAYPDQGANPAALLSRAVLALPQMVEAVLSGADSLLMFTVIGLRLGGENFGLSASEGRLCLTLRGHRQTDIDALAERVGDFIRQGCAEAGMTCRFELRDVFPDTTNAPDTVEECASIWQAAGLPVKWLRTPMRWSEDFGWYLKARPGMFFGVGIGEDHPGLHTAEYAFDDAVILPAARAFAALAGIPMEQEVSP